MREWNASVYHRVSDPQLGWGRVVLDRLPLHGHERVLDVGCGTGRLTSLLRERVPHGQVIGVDLSANMLREARTHLADKGASALVVQADATALPWADFADAIFSTATFHWVSDHDRLFASLYAALAPGGRLVAQCGGAGNVRRITERCADLMRQPLFAPYFESWVDGWEFADAETTAARLRDAGFEDIETSIEAAPVLQPDADAYREFVAHVVIRRHLAQIQDPALRDHFVDLLTTRAAGDTPPFELDYRRLNMSAQKPSTPARD